MARAPEQLTKSAFGGKFRFNFDSIFEPDSNLVYHMVNQRIEPVTFNYEKVNQSTITINNLLNHYNLEAGYDVIITKNGIYKNRKNSEIREELNSNVKIRGESIFRDYIYFTTNNGLYKIDHARGFHSTMIESKSITGRIVVMKNGDIFYVESDSKIVKMNPAGKNHQKITAQDQSVFKSRPCYGEQIRLDKLEIEEIKSIEYSSTDDSLIIFDIGSDYTSGFVYRIDLQTQEYWTRLVTGQPSHCFNPDDSYDFSGIQII